MRVAVTGATGHLGANVVRALLAHGHEVRALCHSHLKLAALEDVDAEQRQCDVLEPDDPKQAFASVDAVVHTAGVISINGDPTGIVTRTNVEGVRNVVEACLANGVGKLVHVSSAHAMKIGTDEVIDESAPAADAACFRYDQSKARGEEEVRAGVARGLDATILNPTGIIGPFDFAPSRTGRFFISLFAGRIPVLVDGGFDFVDARDVADAVVAALGRKGNGGRTILSGHWASLAELAGLCDAASGRRVRRWAVPIGLAKVGVPFARAAARLTGREPLITSETATILAQGRRVYAHDKATRELGFHPRPLAETVADTRGWLAGRGLL